MKTKEGEEGTYKGKRHYDREGGDDYRKDRKFEDRRNFGDKKPYWKRDDEGKKSGEEEEDVAGITFAEFKKQQEDMKRNLAKAQTRAHDKNEKIQNFEKVEKPKEKQI